MEGASQALHAGPWPRAGISAWTEQSSSSSQSGKAAAGLGPATPRDVGCGALFKCLCLCIQTPTALGPGHPGGLAANPSVQDTFFPQGANRQCAQSTVHGWRGAFCPPASPGCCMGRHDPGSAVTRTVVPTHCNHAASRDRTAGAPLTPVSAERSVCASSLCGLDSGACCRFWQRESAT